MKHTAKVLCVLLVVGLLVSQTPAKPKPTPEPRPQAATAAVLLTQALGSLITAVLPAVPDLTKKLMGGKDSVKQADLAKNIQAQQAETRTQVEGAVANLQKVSAELDSIMKFVPPTAEARKNLLKMKGITDSFPTNDADRAAAWTELTARWKRVTDNLAEVAKVPDSTLDSITNLAERAEFRTFKSMGGSDTVDDLAKVINRKNNNEIAVVGSSITALIDKLDRVSTYQGIHLDELRDSITAVKDIPALKPTPETDKKSDKERLQDLLSEQ